MELITQELLLQEGGLADCPAGGVPMWIVVSGSVDDEWHSSWATLLSAVVWGDRQEFFFALDSRLSVGESVSIRYRDEEFGLITVEGIVGAVVEKDGRRDVHVVGSMEETVAVKLAA